MISSFSLFCHFITSFKLRLSFSNLVFLVVNSPRPPPPTPIRSGVPHRMREVGVAVVEIALLATFYCPMGGERRRDWSQEDEEEEARRSSSHHVVVVVPLDDVGRGQ